MSLQMAWRNVWRNKRRTKVILTAVVIGCWSMIFLGAIMQGMAANMLKNGISTLTGHLQIHEKGYRSDPVIENSITSPKKLYKILNNSLPKQSHWAARVRVNAISANARNSTGVTLLGIQPKKEVKVSFLGQAITQGKMLSPQDKTGIIVGKAFLRKFETKLGRKLVLMSQNSKGEIASRSFRIKGVFQAELEATEKQFVFVSLKAAQKMLKLKNGISEISILLPKKDLSQKLSHSLSQKLPPNLTIQTWKELLPLLSSYLEMMGAFTAIWYLVVFIAMGFGIVNTTLMAVFERMREFGLFKALGMRPWWIIKEVLSESGLILLIGMTLGTFLGWLSVLFLAQNGIDLSAFTDAQQYLGMTRIIYPVLQIKDVIMANCVIFFLGLLVSAYPAVKAARFTPVEAMTHI